MVNLQNVTPKKRKRARWEAAFIAALARLGVVTYAARAARITTQTVYVARRDSQEFAEKCKEALQEAADRLEKEAIRRAITGLVIKKFDKGQPIIDPTTGKQYVEREYSDTLLIFLLKGMRPEKYRESISINNNVAVSQVTDNRKLRAELFASDEHYRRLVIEKANIESKKCLATPK